VSGAPAGYRRADQQKSDWATRSDPRRLHQILPASPGAPADTPRAGVASLCCARLLRPAAGQRRSQPSPHPDTAARARWSFPAPPAARAAGKSPRTPPPEDADSVPPTGDRGLAAPRPR